MFSHQSTPKVLLLWNIPLNIHVAIKKSKKLKNDNDKNSKNI